MIGKYIVIIEKKFELNEYHTPINFYSMPWVFQKYALKQKTSYISEVFFQKKSIRKSGFPNPKNIQVHTMHTQKRGHWKHLWKSLGRQNFH